MCRFRRVDHSHQFQLDPCWQNFKQSPPSTKQHWDEMNLQLVEQSCLECRLRRIGAMDQYIAFQFPTSLQILSALGLK